MLDLSAIEICNAIGGEMHGDAKIRINGVCIDSRKSEQGKLFVAIKGENFDGNRFAVASLETGCNIAITSEDISLPPGKAYIKVSDTVAALARLATYNRQRFNVKLVGITGSVGKTTTKEMVYKAVSSELETHKTKGNFNNEIGLPLTLLELEGKHDAAVIEMGMSAFGEISLLSEIARPDVGIITNIGMSHIEHLKTRENILKAKMEILDGMKKGATLILNGDDEYLKSQKPEGLNVIYYGVENEKCDVNAVITGDDTILVLGENIKMPVPGRHNISNAAAAMAAARALGLSLSAAARGIEEYKPDGIRQTVTVTDGGVHIMSDYYNASPQSVIAALEVLKNAKAKRKIAVLGDMLELGSFSEKAHKEVGAAAAKAATDILVTVGGRARFIAKGALEGKMDSAHVHSFDDNKSAAEFLKTAMMRDDMVLIKGSRGMKMEEIYKEIYENEGDKQK